MRDPACLSQKRGERAGLTGYGFGPLQREAPLGRLSWCDAEMTQGHELRRRGTAVDAFLPPGSEEVVDQVASEALDLQRMQGAVLVHGAVLEDSPPIVDPRSQDLFDEASRGRRSEVRSRVLQEATGRYG